MFFINRKLYINLYHELLSSFDIATSHSVLSTNILRVSYGVEFKFLPMQEPSTLCVKLGWMQLHLKAPNVSWHSEVLRLHGISVVHSFMSVKQDGIITATERIEKQYCWLAKHNCTVLHNKTSPHIDKRTYWNNNSWHRCRIQVCTHTCNCQACWRM